MISVKRNSAIYSRKIKGKWVLLEKNKVYIRELNSSAGFLWELVTHPLSLDFLADRLVEKYNISIAVAQKDVDTFIKSYLKEGFLTYSSSD